MKLLHIFGNISGSIRCNHDHIYESGLFSRYTSISISLRFLFTVDRYVKELLPLPREGEKLVVHLILLIIRVEVDFWTSR